MWGGTQLWSSFLITASPSERPDWQDPVRAPIASNAADSILAKPVAGRGMSRRSQPGPRPRPYLFDSVGIAPRSTLAGQTLSSDIALEAAFASLGMGAPDAEAFSAASRGCWRNGGEWPRRKCLRTGFCRLDLNVHQRGAPIPTEESYPFLAHFAADPEERVNLAQDPEHGEMAARLPTVVLPQAAGAMEPDHVPIFSPGEATELLPPRMAAGAAP